MQEVKEETGSSAAAKPGDSSKAGSIPRWLVVTAVATLAVVIIALTYGYLARPGWVGVSGKTFWDYLELLIVPAALAIGVYLLNLAQERQRQAQTEQREKEREAEAAQREREREDTEKARRERELEVEKQRAQDVALQAYLDQMAQMVTDENRPLRRARPGDDLSMVARARTFTVLGMVDGTGKGSVLRFLSELGLINRERPVFSLIEADFNDVDLLRGPLFLNKALLSSAYLSNASLWGAYLIEVDLRSAQLWNADLSWTKLMRADLSGAALAGVDLTDADLTGAIGVTNEELHKLAKSLESATMPNGQKYEEWLKDKEGRKGNGENGGSS